MYSSDILPCWCERYGGYELRSPGPGAGATGRADSVNVKVTVRATVNRYVVGQVRSGQVRSGQVQEVHYSAEVQDHEGKAKKTVES